MTRHFHYTRVIVVGVKSEPSLNYNDSSAEIPFMISKPKGLL